MSEGIGEAGSNEGRLNAVRSSAAGSNKVGSSEVGSNDVGSNEARSNDAGSHAAGPRVAESRDSGSLERRERIVSSALRLFGEHGYSTTSVRMIAEAAGVSQGLLYNYFAGKEALLRAIFERGVAQVAESFEAASCGATVRERLERLVRASFALVRENLPFWRLSYQVRLQRGVLESLGEEVGEWSDSVRLHLEELLAAAGSRSPALEARLLFAAIDGVAQHYALDPERYPLDAVVSALIERFVPVEEERIS